MFVSWLVFKSAYPVQIAYRSAHFGVYTFAQGVEATSLRFTLISVYPLQENGVAKQNAMGVAPMTKTQVSEILDNCMNSTSLTEFKERLASKECKKRVSELFLGMNLNLQPI